MELNGETILDFYRHKNRTVLCQIKVKSEGGKFKNSCRCLSQEHWNAFDKELNALIATIDDWNNEMCLKFSIKPYIQVNVKKSNLASEYFYKCFGAICDETDVDNNFVLECLFDFQLDDPFHDSTESQEYNKSSVDSIYSPLSYTPYTPSRQKYEDDDIDVVKTPGTNFLEKFTSEIATIDRNKVSNSSYCNQVEKKDEHKCHRKEKYLKSKSSLNCQTLENEKCCIVEEETILQPNNFGTERSVGGVAIETNKEKLKIEFEEISITPLASSDNEFGNDNDIDKNIILKESKKIFFNPNESHPSATESTISPFSRKVIKFDKKSKSSEFQKSVRRSERSPSKPKRLLEEQHNSQHLKKSKKNISSLSNKKVFGMDDDDNDDDYFTNNNARNMLGDNKIKTSVFETPANNKKPIHCSSSSSSTKKKLKRDKSSSECEPEKNSMSKWLSKKKLMPLDKQSSKSIKAATKSSSLKALPLKTARKVKTPNIKVDSEHHSKTSTPTPVELELPSKQELELMRSKTKLIQTENAKVRAELEKMRTSPPKEVQILSLQNIPLDDILDTFLTYKSELDEIFKNNHKKDYIKGHDGINHCFVIRLLQQNIQMKMLEKLTEVYSNSKTTTQATLFANALLPEWIIRVYMQKFNFSRQQAIDQIRAQEEFQLHMEDQSDNSLMFD